jgi:hypothetical protein
MITGEKEAGEVPRGHEITGAVNAEIVHPSPEPKKPHRRRALKGVARAFGVVLLAVLMFGVSPDDEAAMRTFENAAVQGESNPEYRAISVEYCVLADAALRTRPFGIPGPALVLGARSLPFAPHRFAVNASSRAHYHYFSGGPLVAYLFFCDEQSVEQFAGILEAIGRKAYLSEADLDGFLGAFHMEYPVCRDAGARQAVATLVRDTRSGEPFKVRKNVGELLLPHVHGLARELGFPEEPARMTPDQQLAVLRRLDDFVKHHDPELWRTKQLNDFCNGIWAQVYGQHYHLIIEPVLVARQVGTWVVVLMFVGMVRRRRRPRETPPPEE